MNIVEALKLAKEQGKKVRPVGAEWFVEFDKGTNTHIKKWKDSDIGSTILTLKHTLKDWEVVKEKPSKETQCKIDSIKFQIVRYCDSCSNCILHKLAKGLCADRPPCVNCLDDWSLKEIVEAYHILKKAGDI